MTASSTPRWRATERSEESQALGDPEGRDGEADPVMVAKTILLRLLSASPKSRQQLADALARKGVPPEAAAEALDRFTELGYVDDSAFARSWVESRRRSRGLAAPALRRELRGKGVPRETIDAVLAEHLDPDSERATALDLVRSKLRRMPGIDDDVATRRLASMLARKGYGSSLAYAVVCEAVAEAAVSETAAAQVPQEA